MVFCRPDGMQSIHSHTDHIRLEEVIQFKEVMEDKYNAVAKKREVSWLRFIFFMLKLCTDRLLLHDT